MSIIFLWIFVWFKVMPEITDFSDTVPYILIAEDSETNKYYLKLLLKDYNYHIVNDGVEVLHQSLKSKPSLILMDVYMPGMKGTVATKIIREIQGLHDVPIIGMSSFKFYDEVENFMIASEFTHYMQRPFEDESFYKLINKYYKKPSNQKEKNKDVHRTYMPPNHQKITINLNKHLYDIMQKNNFKLEELVHILLSKHLNSLGLLDLEKFRTLED